MNLEKFNPQLELVRKYKSIFSIAWKNRKNDIRSKKYLSIEADFLPSSLAVSERPSPVMPHVALWVFSSFILITIAWSIFGKVDIVVVSSGKVLSDGKTKSLQIVEPQIVKRLLVNDGSYVKANDVLIEFDATAASGDSLKFLNDIKRAVTFKLAHQVLLAKLNGINDFDEGRNNYVDSTLLKSTIDIKWTEYIAKNNKALSDINTRVAELNSLNVNENIIKEKLKKQTDLELEYKNMFVAEAISKHAWLEQDSKLMDIIGESKRNSAQITQIKSEITEAKNNLQLIKATEKSTWQDKLNEAEKDIGTATAELSRANHRLEVNTLRAPVSGQVQQLLPIATGSVVSGGQQVMVIVPELNSNEIEVLIENKDIAYIHLGQSAEVKVETFDYTRYGTLPGKVIYISKDAITDDKNILRYTAKILLDINYFIINDKTFSVNPGMSVVVDIKSGKRSIISYFLSPITKTLSEAIRER